MLQGNLKAAPRCPSCSAQLDGWTAAGHDRAPRPGCLTVCFYCAAPLRFGDGLLVLEPLSAEDLAALPDDVRPRFLRLVAATKARVRP